jgi:hypothetical protein
LATFLLLKVVRSAIGFFYQGIPFIHVDHFDSSCFHILMSSGNGSVRLIHSCVVAIRLPTMPPNVSGLIEVGTGFGRHDEFHLVLTSRIRH